MNGMKRLITHFIVSPLSAVALCVGASAKKEIAYAQIFDGPGLESGIDIADGVVDLPSADNPRAIIINFIEAVLDFASLLAVIMIIIAGFYLVLSLGEDEKKDKAKKIIIYTLIGLTVLLLARVIVGLITVFLAGELS